MFHLPRVCRQMALDVIPISAIIETVTGSLPLTSLSPGPAYIRPDKETVLLHLRTGNMAHLPLVIIGSTLCKGNNDQKRNCLM